MSSRFLLFSMVFIFSNIISCQSSVKHSSLKVADNYLTDGLLREAAYEYKKILQKKPDNYVALRNLGIVLIKLGNYKKASQIIEKSLKGLPEDFTAYFHLGEAHRGMNKFDKSIYAYQKALRLSPNEPRTLKALTWSYFKIRYYKAAFNYSKKLLKSSPKDPQAYIISGKILNKINKHQKAITIIEKGLKTNADNFFPYLNAVKADSFFALGQIKKAKKLYRQVLNKQPLIPHALIGMAKCLMKQKNKLSAVKYLKRAIHINPSRAKPYLLLGNIYEKKQPSKAIRAYQKFFRIAAKDPEFLHHIRPIKKRISSLKKIISK